MYFECCARTSSGEKLGFVYFNDVGFLNSGSVCSFAPGGRVSGGGFTRVAGADPDDSWPDPLAPTPAGGGIPKLLAELGMKLGGGGPASDPPGSPPTMADDIGILEDAGGMIPGLKGGSPGAIPGAPKLGGGKGGAPPGMNGGIPGIMPGGGGNGGPPGIGMPAGGNGGAPGIPGGGSPPNGGIAISGGALYDSGAALYTVADTAGSTGAASACPMSAL
jgi:hypothetical protein